MGEQVRQGWCGASHSCTIRKGVTASFLSLDGLHGGTILTVVGVVRFTTALPDHLGQTTILHDGTILVEC